jgi:uncharacterized protein
MREQLKQFTLRYNTTFSDSKLSKAPSDWLEAFHLLTQALDRTATEQKYVVFFDELPWLGTRRSNFITGLGYFWNTWASRRQIVVVICGSAASWMIKKVINDRGGLHNRVTRILYLEQFTLAETEEFCTLRGIHLNRYHLMQIYMAMGGVPMYLDLLRPGLTAEQQIQELYFSPNGYLREEFDRLFSSLFEHYQNHIQVVRTLAERKMGMLRTELIARSEIKNGGMLTTVLDELERSGFISSYGGFGKTSKDVLYRLTDQYLLFYLTFIEPMGRSVRHSVIKLNELPAWRTWCGYAFENLCLLHLPQIRKALGIGGITSFASSFYATAKDGYQGAQIDLVIDRADNAIHLCEIKFSNQDYALQKADTDALQSKKTVFTYRTKTKKHLFTTLIVNQDIVRNSQYISNVDQCVIGDQLFEK